MNNYHMTSVPFYQKKKSLSKPPSIIIIEFNINFDYLEVKQDMAGLSENKEGFLEYLFIVLSRNDRLDNLYNGDYVRDLYSNHNAATDNHFRREITELAQEYLRIILELHSVLESFNLYVDNKLDYHYGTMIDDNTLVLHKPSQKDV